MARSCRRRREREAEESESVAYNRGDYRDKWRIERLAAAVRQQLKIDQLEPLSPFRLADAVPAHVFYPEDFGDPQLARRLRAINWDGFAFCCDGDPTLMILLNPARSERRQAATLMEELAHHLLRHTPSPIRHNASIGFLERSYDRAQEDEAYDLGAAILLPKERIQQDVAAKLTALEIAEIHGCSEELVVYRIKRMRLWQRYEGYAA
jgi:Zn-dependent peptidase ImmA (M78 family)